MAFYRSGSIEIICGPMFSGKTEELIRRVRRAQIARQKVQIFKPTIDSMNEHLLPIFSKRNIQVLPSELPMGDAAIVGSSALVWKELEK